ncbi:MAG: HEAT repeat domain-containing protein [Planctomycetia bacterium]|nr:HEAT repeat domain-containing protein [Planctomycetia bacterium]
MHGPVHKLAALAVCSGLGLLSGCAATADGVSGLLYKKKTTEEVLNIKTPDDRMKELQVLAKTAKKKTPDEQQQITSELSKEIQRENDPLMRRQILRTLTAFPNPLVSAVLVAAMGDSDTEVRIVACRALGKRGGKEAVGELTRVISSDTNLDVRIAAVRALGETRDATALPPLAEALVDPDPAMQFRATAALRHVSGRDFGNDVQAWREYAQTGKSSTPEVSLAQRMRRAFF